MKIYILMLGDYEQYVYGVFTSRKEAEKAETQYKEDYDGSITDIEEWETGTVLYD